MLILFGLLLVLVLTAATGYFVAQEFAYVAVDRGRLRRLADDGDLAAGRALRITARLSFVLSGAQLGITVTALLVGNLAEPYLGAGLGRLLGRTGMPAGVSLSLGVVLALLVATVIQMVLGELAPKNLAIARAEALAKALARSTGVYLMVAGPLVRVFDASATRLLRRVGIEPVEELPMGATPDELIRIVATARTGGELDETTSRLLDRGLDFRSRTAGQAMTPRVDVVTVRADEPASRVVELLGTRHSRFPVTRDGIDDVIGVAGPSGLLAVPVAERSSTPVEAIAEPPLLLPESMSLPAALERLRAARRQLACVMDEYGGFAGVLTLEDVAEELVGPIRDEEDTAEPAPVRQPDGSWLVPARWRIDEVADATGITLPEDDVYETVSGLVLEVLGRLPEIGDRVQVVVGVDPAITAGGGDAAPDDGAVPPERSATVEVLSVDRHVPGTVRLRLLDPAAPAASADPSGTAGGRRGASPGSPPAREGGR